MKKTILHVFNDEKFFDGVSSFFNSLKDVENLYYYYSKEPIKSFKYIKHKERVKIVSSFNEYKNILSSPNIDIIYFQSLPSSYYYIFKYINPNTIIIWWCFGYEIYNNYRSIPALVHVDLFKPLTDEIRKSYINKNIYKNILRSIYYKIRYPFDYYYRRRIINRIDYFSPVLPIEYKLMKKNKYFKAKPFMINQGPGCLSSNKEFRFHSKEGNILIGNSLTYSNNHLDILNRMINIKIENKKIIIPVNYGCNYGGSANVLKQYFQSYSEKTIWLEDFILKEKYEELLSTVSHAIFGHMRQQSMGNIVMCLQTGVKVFLFKESINYKQLKEFGYIVFTIEDDLSEESLKVPLSQADAFKNYSIWQSLSTNMISRTEEELDKIMSLRN